MYEAAALQDLFANPRNWSSSFISLEPMVDQTQFTVLVFMTHL